MTKNSQPKKISKLIEELESKVERLREGSDDLEDSIKLYKEGMALAGECEKRLKEAQLEIEKIAVPQEGDDDVLGEKPGKDDDDLLT